VKGGEADALVELGGFKSEAITQKQRVSFEIGEAKWFSLRQHEGIMLALN